MPRTETQKRADLKSRKKIYDQANVSFRKDAEINGEFIKFYTFTTGESINGFLLRAIEETIKNDKLNK